MEDSIRIDMPRTAAELIRKTIRIALKAHRNTPSPVDIKLELADLDESLLEQLENELSQLL